MQRILAVLILLGLASAQMVRIPQGSLQGGINQAAQVAYFLGIPYAKAERWKAPVPVVSWEGLREATQVGNACPQRASLASRFGGYLPPQSEDCLNLNVWMPLGAPPQEGWPVMVWIHGGSFTSGASGEPVYDGTALASHGVILVSINYRLGVFGYLALPALQAEDANRSVGNYGTLDQIEALRWVQRSIGAFGGNPHNLTIFGQSAGGMSVCTLLASPQAKGLFQKAVLQSGGCEYVKTLEQGFKYGQDFAKLNGCDPADLACLRALPVEKFFPPEEGDLFQLLNRLTGESFPDRPYKPHIDGYVLDMAPLEALRQGRAAGIPLIAGATTQEAWGERLLLSDWNTFAQKVQQYLPDRYPVVIQDYRGRYSDPGEAWAYLVGNFVLLCPTLDAAKAQAAFAPTYAYIFDYRSEVFPEVGSFHGAEIPWLFGTQTVWPVWLLYLTAQALHDSLEAAARLQAYWIRFAQDSEPGGWPRWPQYNRGEVLYFNDLLGLRPDPYLARCGVLR